MIKLGHILYSNCFPPHAGIVSGMTPLPFPLVEGIPSELNRLLSLGEVDVSPSSSIEFARNADRYRVLPGLSITSRAEVRSIILQSRFPMQDLHGKKVGLTAASATSQVLLRILLEVRDRVHPSYTTFRQGIDDPFGNVDAMLFIGDLALNARATPHYPYLFDLGAEWHRFTGLPFVFALWQVNYKKDIDNDLERLYDILMQSKQFGLANIPELAAVHAGRFGLPASLLTEYWNSFSYDLTSYEEKGLMTYYGYAAEIGVLKTVQGLVFWNGH
jgi:chorismate dehydratase